MVVVCWAQVSHVCDRVDLDNVSWLDADGKLCVTVVDQAV